MNSINQIELQGTALAVIAASSVSTIVAADESDILGKLAAKVAAFKPDISTAAGRDEMRSLAYEIARSKSALVKIGKGLTENWRQSTKAVNAECNIIEERMDELRDKVRAPLTAWENAEKDRVAAHESALAALAVDPAMRHATADELSAAIRARRELEARNWQEFHERAIAAQNAAIATLVDWHGEAEVREAEAAELIRLRAEDAERERQEAERLQREREERIAAEAAERARIEAEAKAERARQEDARQAEAERVRVEREAREATDRAEAQRRDAEDRAEKAERARIDAAEMAERNRIEAEAKAEMDRISAVRAEQKRAADEKAASEAEEARRAANVAHRGQINRDALAALVAAGITEDHAKIVIAAIARGTVPHVSIRY